MYVYLTGLILPLFLREENILSKVVFFDSLLAKKIQKILQKLQKSFFLRLYEKDVIDEKVIFTVQNTGFCIALLANFPLLFT